MTAAQRSGIVRKMALPMIALALLVAGSQATAQKRYPVHTLNDLATAMKMVDRNVGGANAALAGNDFSTAKAQLTRAREQLATTITFWRQNKKDDAIKMLRETLTTLDDLDTALSAEKVDATAVLALVKQVGARCDSCHAVYRDQDPITKAYRLKPGSVESERAPAR